MYDRIGLSPTYEHRPLFDTILSWVPSVKQVDAGQLAEVIRRCRDGFSRQGVADA